MISLTKINDSEIVINPEFIEIMQETPDTTITLSTGRKLIVKESVDEIINKVRVYKKSLFSESMREE